VALCGVSWRWGLAFQRFIAALHRSKSTCDNPHQRTRPSTRYLRVSASSVGSIHAPLEFSGPLFPISRGGNAGEGDELTTTSAPS
jgi:hypothetical protein